MCSRSFTGSRRIATPTSVRRLGSAVLWLLAVFATDAAADLLPSRPISLWNGRLVVSGEVTVSFGSQDDAYFNALDYSHDAFNLLSVSVSAELRAHDRVAVLAEVIDEVALRGRSFGPTDWHVIRPYALFVRVRPLKESAFYVQAGRIPPVFGRFARLDYAQNNPLIGVPLAYHYPTVMRGDVAPANVQQLLENRGNGWRVGYPPAAILASGSQGVPLVSARRWDTGVQGKWDQGTWDVGLALTSGTLSRPLTDDDNGGKQISGRVGVKPVTGLELGASIARGEFVADAARLSLPNGEAGKRFRQDAWGVDGEYSVGYVVFRGEIIGSRWATPFSSGETTRRLGAMSGWLEGRVTLSPRWYVAVRGERLGFESINRSMPAMPAYGEATGGTSGAGPPADVEWDAPVSRVEAGAGYRIRRNLRIKVSWQENWRDGGRIRRDTLVGTQLVYWF